MKLPERKPRGDAVLKTLPPDRQREIAEYAAANTLVKTVAWLASDGINVSKDTVSKFLSWWQSQQFFAANEATADAVVEQIAKEVQGLSDEELDELGQKAFSLLAIRTQNLSGFVKVRSAVSKGKFEKLKIEIRQAAETRLREKAKLEREKFEFNAAEAALKQVAKLKAISTNKQLSDVEKLRQARLALFGTLPEEAAK